MAYTTRRSVRLSLSALPPVALTPTRAMRSITKSEALPRIPKKPYHEMATMAMKTIDSDKGVLVSAIRDFIVTTYDVRSVCSKTDVTLEKCLKQGVSSGHFKLVGGSGDSGRYALKSEKPVINAKIQGSDQNRSYYEVILTAIQTLDEKRGSSLNRIHKFIQENYQPNLLSHELTAVLRQHVRKGVQAEYFKSITNGSFFYYGVGEKTIPSSVMTNTVSNEHVLRPRNKRGPPTLITTIGIGKHPSYTQMITDAINDMADRNGSTVMKILRYIRENYDLRGSKKVYKYVHRCLSSGVENGHFKYVSGSGIMSKYVPGEKIMVMRFPPSPDTSGSPEKD